MKIAIVQVRGVIGLSQKKKDTLRMLKLPKNHSCVIIESNSSYKGMLIELKDYITWGEINHETFKALLTQRGRLPGNQPLTEAYLKEKTKMNIENWSILNYVCMNI